MVRYLWRFSIFIFFLASFFSTSIAFGQERVEIPDITSGSGLIAITKIPLRESYPAEGVFYKLGKRLGDIQEGEELKAKEVKKVKTLLSNQVWLQVERDPAKLKGGEPASGWVYVGDAGERNCCFTVKK